MSQINQKHEVAFETSALFCEGCGMLLKLQSLTKSEIVCKFCDLHTNLDKLIEQNAAIVHSKSYN